MPIISQVAVPQPIWFEMLVDLSPMIAAAIAMVVTFVTVNRQIRAASRSSYRSNWVESLRKDIAQLMSVQSTLAFAVETKLATAASLKDSLGEIAELTYRIRLLINPNNERHALLEAAMLQAPMTLTDSLELAAGQVRALATCCEKVVDAARPVLNAEWEKISLGM